jgi:peptidylprolyl isomerase
MPARLAAALLLLAACAPAAAPPPAAFSPSLGVELEAMTATASGLRHRDLVEGTGPQPATGRRAEVLYGIWLADGTQVDARVDRSDPAVFTVGSEEVIRGLDEGVRGMRVVGRRQLVVPPALAYGRRGVGAIPPGATLVVVVELVGIR